MIKSSKLGFHCNQNFPYDMDVLYRMSKNLIRRDSSITPDQLKKILKLNDTTLELIQKKFSEEFSNAYILNLRKMNERKFKS